jgi:hypothetical protein
VVIGWVRRRVVVFGGVSQPRLQRGDGGCGNYPVCSTCGGRSDQQQECEVRRAELADHRPGLVVLVQSHRRDSVTVGELIGAGVAGCGWI